MIYLGFLLCYRLRKSMFWRNNVVQSWLTCDTLRNSIEGEKWAKSGCLFFWASPLALLWVGCMPRLLLKVIASVRWPPSLMLWCQEPYSLKPVGSNGSPLFLALDTELPFLAYSKHCSCSCTCFSKYLENHGFLTGTLTNTGVYSWVSEVILEYI